MIGRRTELSLERWLRCSEVPSSQLFIDAAPRSSSQRPCWKSHHLATSPNGCSRFSRQTASLFEALWHRTWRVLRFRQDIAFFSTCSCQPSWSDLQPCSLASSVAMVLSLQRYNCPSAIYADFDAIKYSSCLQQISECICRKFLHTTEDWETWISSKFSQGSQSSAFYPNI